MWLECEFRADDHRRAVADDLALVLSDELAFGKVDELAADFRAGEGIGLAIDLDGQPRDGRGIGNRRRANDEFGFGVIHVPPSYAQPRAGFQCLLHGKEKIRGPGHRSCGRTMQLRTVAFLTRNHGVLRTSRTAVSAYNQDACCKLQCTPGTNVLNDNAFSGTTIFLGPTGILLRIRSVVLGERRHMHECYTDRPGPVRLQ
ncbi:hypothetical protein SPHV1_230136 [Novosphingobium sp. KN65.2]|nr:hypothetical protein SPHV1_230136 [Novosphingobium sp. KN65.2]